MSKANEMFENLGYIVEEDECKIRILSQARFGECLKIVFHKDFTDEKYKMKMYEQYVSMQELQAINQKCKELGWIDR